MDKTDAKRKAHAFLCEHITMEECTAIPDRVPYAFNPDEDFLFRFSLFAQPTIDGEQYVSVSKATGAINLHG